MTRGDAEDGAWDGDSIGETRADVMTRGSMARRNRRKSVRVSVDDSRVLDQRRLRAGLKQLVRAVNVLHQRGLLHLDIKPSNIVVGRGGRVVLLDFGLVRPFSADQTDTKLTLGTPAYMAPEQAAGEPVGRSADWYAVGGVLYRALTGELPFAGGAADVMLAKQRDCAQHPIKLVPDLPEDLANLAADLLHLEPARRPSGREVWARIGGDAHETFSDPDGPSVFVGRTREVEALSHALETAAKGNKVVVRLAGAAAVGKTTLIRRVLSTHRDEIFLLEGETFERESLPFVSFDRPVDSLALILQRLCHTTMPPALEEQIIVLGRMFPVLGALVAESSSESAQVGDSRSRGAQALCKVIAWLSSQGKLPVLWIDSAHWSDRDSALLMRALLSSDLVERVLVVLSYRRGEGADSPLLSDLERLERVDSQIGWRQMDLSPLADEEVKDLARSLMSDTGDEKVVEAIALESAGNPLFVEAMCRYSRGLKGGAITATELSLHHVVAQTFEALHPTARRLLETLAVFGRPMSVDMLFPAALLEDKDRVESVEALVNEHIVATHQGKRTLMLSIAHDKTRELIVAWIEPEVLTSLHRSIAEALAKDENHDPERLMHHFAEGGILERAATFGVMAAGRALDSLAFDSASRLYERALGWLSDARPVQQLPVRLALADALRRAGHRRRAALEYLYAADQCEDRARAEIRVVAGETLVSSGRLLEGLRQLEEYLGGAPLRRGRSGADKSDEESELARSFDEVLSMIREGASQPRLQPADPLAFLACAALARGLSLMLPAECAAYWTKGMLVAHRAGDETFLLRALGFMCIGRSLGGSQEALDESVRWMSHFDAGVERLGRPELGVGRCLYDAATGMVAGDLQRVKLSVSNVFSLAERYGDVGDECMSMAHGIALERRWMMGGLRKLFDDARRIQRFAPRGGDRFLDVLTEVYLALDDLADHAPVQARQRVRAAQDLLDEGYFTPLHYLTLRAMLWCDLYDGETSAAYWRLEGAWPQIRDSGLLGFRTWATEIQLMRGLLMLSAAREGTASPRRARTYAEKAFEAIAEDSSALGRGGRRLLGAALRDAGSSLPEIDAEIEDSPDAYEVLADGQLWLRAMGQRWIGEGDDAEALALARQSVAEALGREGVRRPEAFLRIVNI